MKISILTIFPEIFSSFLQSSLIGKAITSGKLSVKTINIRDFASAPHYQVDDIPYGGGAGMVMKPEPLALALEAAKKEMPNAKVVLFSASGEKLEQSKVVEFSKHTEIILVCARYEGLDQRIIENYVDHEVCIGDYILMGGETPAMVFIEATARFVPEIIGNAESLNEESFMLSDESGLLIEGPHYTRPADFNGQKVPEVLTSGDHKKIQAWRREMAVNKRKKYRSDLIKK